MLERRPLIYADTNEYLAEARRSGLLARSQQPMCVSIHTVPTVGRYVGCLHAAAACDDLSLPCLALPCLRTAYCALLFVANDMAVKLLVEARALDEVTHTPARHPQHPLYPSHPLGLNEWGPVAVTKIEKKIYCCQQVDYAAIKYIKCGCWLAGLMRPPPISPVW